jgi:sugar phosphate isomerase/epimerase
MTHVRVVRVKNIKNAVDCINNFVDNLNKAQEYNMKLHHYGMPTLIETSNLEECASLCAKLELDFIELNMNLPQYQLDKIDVDYFRSIAEKYNIYYTIHLDENLNIGDFNSYVAEAYKKTVVETIEIANQLDIKVLNMHMAKGVYFTLPDRKVLLFSEYKEQYLKSIIKFRNMCETAIGDADIKICIENCDGYENFQKEAIELLLESEVFALTFDVGHNHGIGGTDEEFIMKHKDRLCHIHLHDAQDRKNHLALGTGEIDIKKYLSLVKEQNCRVVLETKTIDGLKQSVKWIEKF